MIGLIIYGLRERALPSTLSGPSNGFFSSLLSKAIASTSSDLLCAVRNEDNTESAAISLHHCLMFLFPPFRIWRKGEAS